MMVMMMMMIIVIVAKGDDVDEYSIADNHSCHSFPNASVKALHLHSNSESATNYK